LAWLALAAGPGRLGSRSLQEAARRPGRGLSRMVGEWIGEQRSVADLRGLAGRMKQARDQDKINAFADDVETIGRIGATSAAAALVHVRDEIGLGSAVTTLDTSRNWTNRASHGDDLDALIQLAGLHDDIETFADWLEEQLATRAPRGARVQLHTVHRVKGLEWPHVIVHEASARLFPHHLSSGREEERRIFHVAITRCSSSVTIVAPRAAPSPFIAELGEKLDPSQLPTDEPDAAPVRQGSDKSPTPRPRASGALADTLRSWRMDKARQRDVPAYVIFNDKTLDDLLARRPATLVELQGCVGIGPAKVEAFGAELLEVIGSAPDDGPGDASPPSASPSPDGGARPPPTAST
jgi:DNA helicase-2/ATP-dependent DNA helicase PcrA